MSVNPYITLGAIDMDAPFSAVDIAVLARVLSNTAPISGTAASLIDITHFCDVTNCAGKDPAGQQGCDAQDECRGAHLRSGSTGWRFEG